MFERSELRSRREERMENGVKNLKGNEAISQNLPNKGNGDACHVICLLTWYASLPKI
jgi:hypothetical protein